MKVRTYPEKKNTLSQLRELWNYREFVLSLIVRNLKVKYQGSFFGFLWTLMNPLMTVAVLTIVFSRIVRIDLENYWAFLLSGYFVWNFINQSINAATYVLVEHAELSRSIAYPKEAPLIAAVSFRFIEFCLEMSLILLTLFFFHHDMKFQIGFLFVPWLASLLFLLVLAVMFPLATLSVYYRDVYHGLPIVLATLFYITPIFYPAHLITGNLKIIFILNPFAPLLKIFQDACYYGVMPSLATCFALTVCSLIFLYLGYFLFNRFKGSYAEII